MEKFSKTKEETDEALAAIKQCPTLGEVDRLVRELLPGWIIEYLVDYSIDYPHLRDNFRKSLDLMNASKGMIMIVDFIGFSDEYKLTQEVSELYTTIGFIVRSRDELETCPKCNLAIPGEAQWKQMLEVGLPVPKVYSTQCVECVEA